MKKVSSYQTLMVSVTNANIIVAKKFFQTLFILFILEDCPYFILLILSFLACWFLFSPFWYFIYHLIRAKRYENRDKEPFEHKRRGGVKKLLILDHAVHFCPADFDSFSVGYHWNYTVNISRRTFNRRIFTFHDDFCHVIRKGIKKFLKGYYCFFSHFPE